MDASKTGQSSNRSGPGRDSGTCDAAPTVSALRRPRTRRSLAALAALLAVAVALPVGVDLAHERTPARSDNKTGRAGPTAPVTTAAAVRQARASGQDVEISAERTANSTTWARPDGLLRTRSYSDTIRAKVGGTWRQIDTDLHRVEGGYAPKAVNDPLLFSAGSTHSSRASRTNPRPALPHTPTSHQDGTWTELVRLTVEGHQLTVSWPGPLPEPVIDGSRALYENVRPGIDLLLTARDSGYSHALIVHTREAASDPLLSQLNYRLASPDLTFRLDAESHVVRALDASGDEVASSPTPYAWDSAGDVKTTIGEPKPTLPLEVGDTALALPGIAGPQPGSHDAVLNASLDTGNTLALTVSKKLLSDPDTVYPVFIDPSFKGRKKNWTLLYQKHPSSSFYNGQNFNDGTNDARVGYESDSGGLSRSVFTFEFDSKLHGTTVKSATFRALQTYSWGCAARQYNLHLTSAISSTSTWNKQPTWGSAINTGVTGHGYKATSCPDKWIALDIKPEAQQAATSKKTAITLGLRAANESSAEYWKKFQANGESSPYIEVVHNRPPNEPTGSLMKTYPGGTCDTLTPYLSIGKSDITFTSSASDADGNLKYLHLKVWKNGQASSPLHDADHATNSSGAMSAFTMPWNAFTHGVTYSWAVYSKDAEGATSAWGPPKTTAFCQFTVDHTAPSSPEVASTTFPEPGEDGSTWSTVTFGTAGEFTFQPNGTPTEVKEYQYSFNTAFDKKAVPNTVDGHAPDAGHPLKPGEATYTLKPPHAGPSVLYVRSADASGNISGVRKYQFNVRPSPELDTAGDVTGDKVPDMYTISGEGNLEMWSKTLGTDRLHFSMPAAYTTSDGATNPVDDGYWTGALISHNGDWLPGDGTQDLVARMADGKLYLYPGDGYGGFDVNERHEILMPAGAPAPASLTQILSIGDATGDGRPDLLATAGTTLWAFTGYTGASLTTATQLSGDDWTLRDLVQVGNIAGDSALDLVYRTDTTGKLYLRKGKKHASGTGTDLFSFAVQTASADGIDFSYGTSGWATTAMPIVIGSPDVTGDAIPDVWTLKSDGNAIIYPGSSTTSLSTTNMFNIINSSVGTTWSGYTAIG
ncbi:DNRLRE domain-containing protein [Streptomyces sp. AM8-1-1]|uniref:DNRLRE domain-containing protein n=1 Tax=Streptomyces sp. AM8-1-1 TaxID=3075825 RepID=UPI0028C47B51|nr:DNRLRE domain-containing protein [Streptomyces sp. AM8-1-1]WNO76949.1 DNRLRE domain-containing protein [Streptomyces sp. AM8-1-1]